jgi:UDP-N-acetylglucosamine 2-epimerase
VTTLAVVVGIRSQFIKAAALQFLQDTVPSPLSSVALQLINTAQHFDPEMTTELLGGLWPAFDVTFTHDSKDTGDIFATSIARCMRLWSGEARPAAVLVFGDGNPAAVGAIAAVKSNLPLVHIEAGAKRGRHEQEEVNRRLVDTVADLHLCTTTRAVGVLAEEGREATAHHVGDLSAPFLRKIAAQVAAESEDLALITLHRPENMDSQVVASVVAAAADATREVIFVAHPRVAPIVRTVALPSNVQVLGPQSYDSSIRLALKSRVVITDSGGLIREAYLLGRPVVVRRDAGGWPELMDREFAHRATRDLSDLERAISWALRADIQAPVPGDLPFLPDGGIKIALDAIAKLCSSAA